MEESKRNEEPPASTAPSGEYDYSSTHKKTNNSSVDVNKINDIERKKSKVLEFDSKGYTQQEIADVVGISQPTVSRYLKEALEASIESRTNYARQTVHDLHRAKLGQDRALKGLWSIADDPHTIPSDRIRAYSVILLGNSRKIQATGHARNLSHWLDEEDLAQRRKEYDSLSNDEKFKRALLGRGRP